MEETEKRKMNIPKKLRDSLDSKFRLVECPDCSSHQVVYSHASMKVECSVCGRTLVEPTGGKARIYGEVLKEYP